MLVNATGGGGGYGDPLKRDFDAISADVRNEFLTPEAVERDYKVIIDKDGVIDHEATAELRDSYKSQKA